MPSLPSLVESYLAGIQIVRQAVAGMTPEQLKGRPVPGKWSTLEVICHLADSDQAWTFRMKRVIAEDRPLLIGYDESRFSQALGYQERNAEEELAYLEQTRRQMGRVLRHIPPEALARTGVHTERGLITLEQMLEVEIDHINHHVKFIREKRKALGLPADTR
jgi:DinB superfamily